MAWQHWALIGTQAYGVQQFVCFVLCLHFRGSRQLLGDGGKEVGLEVGDSEKLPPLQKR